MTKNSKIGWILAGIAGVGAAAAGTWYYLKKKEEEEGLPPTPPIPPTPLPPTPPTPPTPPKPKASIGAIRTFVRPGVGDLIVETEVWNDSDFTYTFNVGVSVGDKIRDVWYDVGNFIDGKGDYATVRLAPGASAWVSRILSIPPVYKDAWVTVRDEDLNVLDMAFRQI